MQYLGKIKVKVSYGAGFNLLCLAAGAALTVKTCNMIAENARASERHKLIKDLKEQSDMLSKMAEYIAKACEKDENKNDDADVDIDEILE